MIIIDRITSILQSAVFTYYLMYCVDEEKSLNKLKFVFLMFMFTFIGIAFSDTFVDNPGMVVFITHMLALGLVILLYNKKIKGAVIAYTIIYCIIAIYSIIFGNIIFAYVKEMLPSQYVGKAAICIVYLPQWILIFLCFKFIKRLGQIYKTIVSIGLLIHSLIISFAIDFIITFYLLTFGHRSQLTKNIIYLMFFIFFVFVLFYFKKIHNKSEQIFRLNETLEVKNNELRKIKHDYGAQISYLYGLCLMERYPDLKKALKDIINSNENVATGAEVSENKNSLFSLALKPAIDQGIHVIIEENCDFNLINMSEMEIYRIVSNIVNNAVNAMDGQGIIIAKSYEYLEKVIIKIENNGPKIEEQHLKDIFKQGFTTKENASKNHGFGLSIVKELVNRHNGKIDVKSTEIATEFKIILPMKSEIVT